MGCCISKEPSRGEQPGESTQPVRRSQHLGQCGGYDEQEKGQLLQAIGGSLASLSSHTSACNNTKQYYNKNAYNSSLVDWADKFALEEQK